MPLKAQSSHISVAKRAICDTFEVFGLWPPYRLQLGSFRAVRFAFSRQNALNF